MRSRKEEFSKRFEETTKQEIKNYNDSLLANNMAMQELREGLKDCIDKYSQQVACLSSATKKLEAENIDLKSSIQKLMKKIESLENDSSQLEKRLNGESKKASNSIQELYSKVDDSRLIVQRLESHVSVQNIDLKNSINNAYDEVGNCYRKCQDLIRNMKEEILSMPSEAAKVKTELTARAEESKIDNSGILRELQIVKKRSFVIEKMNEYFQIQIDRLKAKEG